MANGNIREMKVHCMNRFAFCLENGLAYKSACINTLIIWAQTIQDPQ
jgi:hypothetical protein